MSDHILRTIADLEADIRAQEEATLQLKHTINHLCKRAGIPPKYADNDLRVGDAPTPSAAIAPDEFVGKPLNTAIRNFLTKRKSAGLSGPASPEEIFDALQRGGYEFEIKDKAAALSGLRISLGKSSNAFKKLSNGMFGLIEWYPGVKVKRITTKDAASENDDSEESANGQTNAANGAEQAPTQ